MLPSSTATETWTWREHLADAGRQAAALIGIADHARPLHVGVLLGNTPDMLTAMAAAGLGGYVLCGINNTRRGDALARDIAARRLPDPAHRRRSPSSARRLDLPGVQVLDVGSRRMDGRWWRRPGALTPHREAGATDTFMMIFTSGTSGDPKAVEVPHAMVLFAGSRPGRAATG